MVKFELTNSAVLDELNRRAERLGYGRPFCPFMSPAQYLFALGGITEASLADMERRLGLESTRDAA